MLHRFRGIVIDTGEHWIRVQGDDSIAVFIAPDHETHVGQWVDVAGGGFSGLYWVTPLSVYA